MFLVGDKVRSKTTGEIGTVEARDARGATVIFNDFGALYFPDAETSLEPVDSAPGPSERSDPIHDYWLRHAHNAGMAVQALRIINNNARQALNENSADAGSPHTVALAEVEKFSADVLSHVFPT